jgi:hypothetical protein
MIQLTTKIDKQFLGRLCADAISNLQKACEKHPTFPLAPSNLTLDDVIRYKATAQYYNDHEKGTVHTIAYEEELELNAALFQGLRGRAYDELVDLITVWLRVGLHLTDYVHESGVDLQQPKQTFAAPSICPVDDDKCDRCAGIRLDPCPDAKPKDIIKADPSNPLEEKARAASVEHRAVGPNIRESFLGPTLRGVTVTDDQGRKVMMQP